MSHGDARRRLNQALTDHGRAVRGNSAQCPGPGHANGDRTPSLSIGNRKDGNGIIISCKGGGGCSADEILEALGMSTADLFDEPREAASRRHVVAEYDYTDEHGVLLFRKVRYQPKNFAQYRLVNGEKVWKLGDVRKVLYQLPRVIEAVKNGQTVYVVEGEKDVHAIERAGAVATCNPDGAAEPDQKPKWRDEYSEVLRGTDVIIIADRDESGRAHAAAAAASLDGKARSVRIVEPAVDQVKADATDHLNAGHGLGDFVPAGLPARDADGERTADSAAGGDPVAVRVAQLRAALLDSAALDSIQPPEPVIDGLLYRDGIAWLYGKPGTYKSIIALDWASCVSVGLPWQEHGTRTGPVLYLYAEGAAGLPQRVRAWEDHAGCRTNVIFLPVAVQLLHPVDLAAFTALVAELGPVLLVIDTQARVTVGVEENSTTEMGRLVAAVDAIRRTCAPCVLIVHHEPRGGENMRGAIALEGAATSVFRADRDGARITLENKRQRDTAEADDVILQAIGHLGSVVVVSNEGHWTLPVPSASEKLILGTLLDCFLDTGASATALMEMSKLSKSTFYHAIKTLLSTGQIVNAGTRNRSCYQLPKGRVQLSPTESNAPPESSVQCPTPFKGLDTVGRPGEPDTEQWPDGSHGEADS